VRDQIERSPRIAPMVLAAFVGLVSGLGAVGFAELVDFVDWLIFDVVIDDWLSALPAETILIGPIIGGLLVGPITMRYVREVRGPGVSDVMLAVETAGGRVAPRIALFKPIASALTIGSGGSAGKEGPIVHIGAALGSNVAQALHLSEENVKLLLASGAAAGIAAIFNAPIAGVFFALEVILHRFNTRNFSVIVLASVVATTTAVWLRGDEPVISIPEYELVSAIEIPLFAILGILSGAGAVAFIRFFFWTEERFDDLRVPPAILLPALGGLLVGLLTLVDRGVLGLGENVMDEVLNGEVATRTMLVLLALKFLATSLTLGSGGSGGVFRPSLFLGAMLGGAYGAGVHELLPGQTAEAGAYATVGMAAMVAGTARSPITAVLILFELTRDYGIILPVMTAVATATVVSQLFSRETIFTFKLARRGVEVEEDQPSANVMQSIRVSDAMNPALLNVEADAPITEVARLLSGDSEAVVLVVNDEGETIGIITDTDVNEAIVRGEGDQDAGGLMTPSVTSIFPDQTLHDALTVFGARSITALPVMLRDRPTVACGLLRRSDITNAYSQANEDRDALRRRGRLNRVTSDDVRYLELRVAPSSGLGGRELMDVGLTEDAVIVAVRRNGVTLIPRGHTRLEPGDRVTVISAESVVDSVREAFEGQRRSG
jgi:CIC family chloride channel protein